MAAAPPPSLQRQCLQLLASRLLDAGGSAQQQQSQLHSQLRALPQELQQELLLLLASWQLLDDAACALLAGDGGGGSSVLAGAASVSLANCVLLGSPGLHRLFGAPLPQLQTLSLKGLVCLSDADVEMLAPRLTRLTRLDLSNARQLSAAAVAAVAAGPAAPQLQSLSLAGCWQMAALPGLEACTALTSLNLSGCWQLTDEAVRQVLSATPLLEELSLGGCCHLSSAALVAATLPPCIDAAEVVARRHQAERREQRLARQQRQQAAGGGAAGQEDYSSSEEEVPADVLMVNEEALGMLGFPVQGAVLPQLRTIDVSGTKADDCLLLWLAAHCCCRLQKVVLSNSQVSGRGMAALLRAKRAVLHAHSGHPLAAAGVLPLLEFAAAGMLAPSTVVDQAYLDSSPQQVLAIQRVWEERLGGGMPIDLPPSRTPQPPLLVSLLSPPPGANDAGAPTAPWPPDSAAEVVAALGPRGLGQLQALDVSGCSGVGALADIVATRCSSLQRLRLAGCSGLSDHSLAQVLLAALQLRELDVSGCSGSKVNRPGSRFLRHGKAPRQQEGGVSDASLSLLARPPQQQQQQQQPGTAASAVAAAPAPAKAGLQVLSVGGLSITYATLNSLPSSLTCLSLRGCKRASDTGMLQVLLQCPNLARLDAVGCSQLTAAGFGCWAAQQQVRGSSSRGGGSGSSGGGQPEPPDLEQQLQLFRRVHTTAAAVQLQRVALPRQACTREVLAWLVGQAASSGGGGSGSSGGDRGGPAGWPALQRLELASCSALEEADLLAVAACCPTLKSLQLPSAAAVGGSRLCNALAQRCRLLTRLTLGGGASVADADVALLLRTLPALQHLDFSVTSGVNEVTGAAFSERLLEKTPPHSAAAVVAAGAAQLQQAEGSPAAAAAAAAPAGRSGFALRTLRLDGCRLDDAAVVAIAHTCPHLEVLSLQQCRQLTSASTATALWCCRNLRSLHMTGTSARDCRLPPGGMAPGFPAAAGAAGTPCAPGADPLQALLKLGSTIKPWGTGGVPRPSALTLVELPMEDILSDVAWGRWLTVLSALGAPKLTFQQG